MHVTLKLCFKLPVSSVIRLHTKHDLGEAKWSYSIKVTTDFCLVNHKTVILTLDIYNNLEWNK